MCLPGTLEDQQSLEAVPLDILGHAGRTRSGEWRSQHAAFRKATLVQNGSGIAALLRGEPAPLSRVLPLRFTEIRATITTDASPWGIGGVMRVKGRAPECFSRPIPAVALERFKAEAWPSALAGAIVKPVESPLDWLWTFHRNIPRFKRSVGAGPWQPPDKPAAKARPSSFVLHEGFAIRIPSRSEAKPDATSVVEGPAIGFPSVEGNKLPDGEPRPYGWGSPAAALKAMGDPDNCVNHLKVGMQEDTTKGPTASRRQLWATLAARQVTQTLYCRRVSVDQLQQAAKAAVRSCKRQVFPWTCLVVYVCNSSWHREDHPGPWDLPC